MSKNSAMTITDIARLAQVSKSTVSRALNDSPLIGEETKERIRAIAQQHNFRINVVARQLSLKQSMTIAYVTHCYHKDYSVADLFSMEIMGGISRALYKNGYDMLVVQVNPSEIEWAHEYIDTGRVDGFILMTSTKKQNHIHALLEMGAPFIIWGVPGPNYNCCSVTGDNFTGGKLATEYLALSGRRRIAFIGGFADDLEVQYRYAGYEAAIRGAGMTIDPNLLAYGDYSNTSGARAMRQLLSKAPDIDAVFVNSDLMAIAAMGVIRESGRRVPEDIAVVGYDDLSIAEFCTPPLTTIRQHIPQAGRLLADNLIQYLQTGIITNVTVPVELIKRQSA
jgi:DNA-binding LacI/PurR family transcriptional regulator